MNPDVQYVVVDPGKIIPTRKWRTMLFCNKVEKVIKAIPNLDFSLSVGRTGFSDICIAAGNYPGATKQEIQSASPFRHKLYYLDKISLYNANLILAASQMVKDELIKLFEIEANQINILNPPTNADEFYPLSSDHIEKTRNEMGMKVDQINYLFVSTGHKRKGVELLEKIFEALGEKHQLWIVGDDHETSLSNIHSIGFMENPVDMYNAVDYLIHPASYEAFGQVIAESLLCGTPVLISDKVGAKEIVTPEYGQVIPLESLEKWIDTMKDLKKPEKIDATELKNNLSIQTHINKMLQFWENHQKKAVN